jgi:DNA-binding response OmpR family regulator
MRERVRGGTDVKTVLVVEDDEGLAAALSLRLKREGFRVLVAHDALAGVSMAIREQPDLMVLDINMPAGGGFSVAERVQQQVPKAIPVIVTTGSTDEGVLEHALSLHPVAFFEKPYDGAHLAAMVGTALGSATAPLDRRPSRPVGVSR